MKNVQKMPITIQNKTTFEPNDLHFIDKKQQQQKTNHWNISQNIIYVPQKKKGHKDLEWVNDRILIFRWTRTVMELSSIREVLNSPHSIIFADICSRHHCWRLIKRDEFSFPQQFTLHKGKGYKNNRFSALRMRHEAKTLQDVRERFHRFNLHTTQC